MQAQLKANKDTVFWVTRAETRPNPADLIDWSCPCIPDALKNGPCRDAFAVSYLCFSKSKAEDKGSDCYQEFTRMAECLQAHPEIKAAYEDS